MGMAQLIRGKVVRPDSLHRCNRSFLVGKSRPVKLLAVSFHIFGSHPKAELLGRLTSTSRVYDVLLKR